MADASPKVSMSSRSGALDEERYLWMARAFAVMVVLAIICDVILLIALASVTPVLRVQPFYIEARNKDQQVITVYRAPAETLDSDILEQSLIYQYLMARYGISSDLSELEFRWGGDGPIFWSSSKAVYDEFQKKEASPLLNLAHKDNLTRNVRILSGNKVKSSASGKDIWRVELEFKDVNRSSTEPQVRDYVVEMEVSFAPTRENLSWDQRLKNPLGFEVSKLGISPKR